jgi:serine-type D-Ala-D-Ala carboxypeptidase/endopeptidase (penicillin-binding protein 4)
LREANQSSNNLYAETLLRALGAGRQSSAIEAGLVTLTQTLQQLGVEARGFSLVDGSGLARHNLVSPEALVQTLQAMVKHPAAIVYRGSFSVAGQSGTLRNRFQNTPAQGIVQAKTGTLTGVSALSGYLTSAHYGTIVFSLMINQSRDSAVVQRGAIDEVVVLLTQLRSCN